MSECKIALLGERALVRVGGEDAEKLLQGLITCDVEDLAPGQGAFGALLTPQGKILFDFFVVRDDNGFIMDVVGAMRDDFIRRLNFYKLRAKVDISPLEDMSVYAAWAGTKPGYDGIVVPDPRLADMGCRLYGSAAPSGEGGDYEAHRIEIGMPEGGRDFAYGDTFPHEALMDQFGGVNFTKGCYVGQEVVSRMQHRGTARTRVVTVRATNGELPEAGTEVRAGERVAGTMGSAVGDVGLAKVRLDRISDAARAGSPVLAGDIAIIASLQPWVRFDWPAETGD